MRALDWDETKPLANWQQAVLAFARRTRAALGDRVVHIILYGSRARGDFTEDSDIDVLVVVRGAELKEIDENISWLAWEILEEYGELIMESAIAEDEYKRRRERAFYINVAEEGVVV